MVRGLSYAVQSNTLFRESAGVVGVLRNLPPELLAAAEVVAGSEREALIRDGVVYISQDIVIVTERMGRPGVEQVGRLEGHGEILVPQKTVRQPGIHVSIPFGRVVERLGFYHIVATGPQVKPLRKLIIQVHAHVGIRETGSVGGDHHTVVRIDIFARIVIEVELSRHLLAQEFEGDIQVQGQDPVVDSVAIGIFRDIIPHILDQGRDDSPAQRSPDGKGEEIEKDIPHTQVVVLGGKQVRISLLVFIVVEIGDARHQEVVSGTIDGGVETEYVPIVSVDTEVEIGPDHVVPEVLRSLDDLRLVVEMIVRVGFPYTGPYGEFVADLVVGLGIEGGDELPGREIRLRGVVVPEQQVVRIILRQESEVHQQTGIERHLPIGQFPHIVRLQRVFDSPLFPVVDHLEGGDAVHLAAVILFGA